MEQSQSAAQTRAVSCNNHPCNNHPSIDNILAYLKLVLVYLKLVTVVHMPCADVIMTSTLGM